MVSKNQSETKGEGHLFLHQNLQIKGKVETGHSFSPQRPDPPTGLSGEQAVETEDLLFRFLRSRLHHPCAPDSFI